MPIRPLDRAGFMASVGGNDPRAASRLYVLMDGCDPDAPFTAQRTALEQLARFVIAGRWLTPAERLALVVVAAERVPAARERLVGCLACVLAASSAERLFTVVGLPNDRGLFAETADRLARRLLPSAPDEHCLAELAARVVRSPRDHAWLTPAVEPLLERLGVALAGGFVPLAQAAADAIDLLAMRVAALGTSEVLRRHRLAGDSRAIPFFALGRATLDELPGHIAACRAELRRIHRELEQTGVSVEVVYTLDALQRGLDRIEALLPLATSGEVSAQQARELVDALAFGVVGERSFRHVLTDNLRLLARKVIERAGRTGEHYVTSSRREYLLMLASAAGGGAITAGTAITKFLIKWQHFPLFLDGLTSSLLYAVSFLVIQFLGFTLATKQPSMTAAALAGTIRDGRGPDRLADLVDLITRIIRSQIAAAVGNVATVVVVAVGFDLAWRELTGASFLDPSAARAVIDSFHPLESATVLFAALTGVLLWMSSVVAGWFENWIVYRRIPGGIEHHRLGKRFGKQRLARLARGLEHHAAGIGGSVSLGFLLGMTPVFARFFGLPLDVRHVTLSSGALALACSSLGLDALGWDTIGWACVGIAVIGILNFGVSFVLAMFVALRARDVPARQRRYLIRAVLVGFVRHPLRFFLPPRDPPRPPPPA